MQQMAPKPSTTAAAVPTRQSVPSNRSRDFDFMEWFQVNSKIIVGAAFVVAVAALGYWFYVRSQQIKTVNAERSLMQAEQSLQSGNTALATRDLQRVVTRYKGTAAGPRRPCFFARPITTAGNDQDGVRGR